MADMPNLRPEAEMTPTAECGAIPSASTRCASSYQSGLLRWAGTGLLPIAATLATTLVALPANAQLDLGASAEAEASADGDSAEADTSGGAEASQTERAEDAEEPEPEQRQTEKGDSGGASESAPAEGAGGVSLGTPMANIKAEVVFGNRYRFGTGRLMGLPFGSVGFNPHGLQMDYRDTGLVISGDTWIDTGYRSFKSEPKVVGVDEDKFLQEGRFNLRVTPTFTFDKHWFIKAQAEILAHAQEIPGRQLLDTDDAWLKIGYWDLFDFQVGRFEAWEVYHKGLGLERDTLEDLGATPPEGSDPVPNVDIYEVNFMLYRQDEPGQLAVHFYPLDWMRFEVAGLVGVRNNDEILGWRPAAILDFGFLKIKAAGEFVDTKDPSVDDDLKREERAGVGGGIIGILNGIVEGGVSGAIAKTSVRNQLGNINREASYQATSVGGFLNARFEALSSALAGTMIGFGANYSQQSNEDCGLRPLRDDQGNLVTDTGAPLPPGSEPFMEDICGFYDHTQLYGALQQTVFRQANIKLVLGLADANFRFGPDSAIGADANRRAMFGRVRFLVWY